MKAGDLVTGSFVTLVISVNRALPTGPSHEKWLRTVCSAVDAGVVNKCETSGDVCVGKCRVHAGTEVYTIVAGDMVSVFVDIEL